MILLLLLLCWTRKSKMDFYSSSSSWVFFFWGKQKLMFIQGDIKNYQRAREKSIKLFFCHFLFFLFVCSCLRNDVLSLPFLIPYPAPTTAMFIWLWKREKREEMCILIVDICSKIKNKQFSKLHWKNQVDDAQYAIFGNKFSRFLCNVTFVIDFMKFIYFLLFLIVVQ